jgi:pantetheine-phosphate adenylyltransferase
MRTHKRGQRLGVYAGSFDPLTIGHLWMIEQGARLFDRLTVAVGVNPDKKYSFPLEERLRMLRESTKPFQKVSVASFSNRYLIHYAQLIGATHILRGIRTESDYEFERTMRNINGDLDSTICTVFLMPPAALPRSVRAWCAGSSGRWVGKRSFASMSPNRFTNGCSPRAHEPAGDRALEPTLASGGSAR